MRRTGRREIALIGFLRESNMVNGEYKNLAARWVFIGAVVSMVLPLAVHGMGNRPPPPGRFQYKLDQYADEAPPGTEKWKQLRQMQLPLEEASAIDVDDRTNIVAAGKSRAIIYDSSLRTVAGWRIESPADCVGVDQEGTIYIGAGDHVEVYRNSRLEKRWEPYNRRSILTSITVIGDKVFVADAGNKKILCYSRDGDKRKSFGNSESNSRMFVIPSPYMDIASDREQTLWVADTGRRKLKNFDVDGKFISEWGRSSHKLSGFSGCCNPAHFAILPHGSFATAEKGLVRVKVHKPNGELDSLVFGSGFLGSNVSVADLAAGPGGLVYVLDSRGILRVFGRDDAE